MPRWDRHAFRARRRGVGGGVRGSASGSLSGSGSVSGSESSGGPRPGCVARGDAWRGAMEAAGTPAGCGASAQALVPVQAEASAVALPKEAPQEAPKCRKRVLDEDAYIQVSGRGRAGLRGTRLPVASRPSGCFCRGWGPSPLLFYPPPRPPSQGRRAGDWFVEEEKGGEVLPKSVTFRSFILFYSVYVFLLLP